MLIKRNAFQGNSPSQPSLPGEGFTCRFAANAREQSSQDEGLEVALQVHRVDSQHFTTRGGCCIVPVSVRLQLPAEPQSTQQDQHPDWCSGHLT